MRETHKAMKSLAFRNYLLGFCLSLVLTVVAYGLVKHHLDTHHLFPSDKAAVILLMILALTQLMVQVIFFLHLGQESKPRWRLVMFLFAAAVVFIVVGGSLWIMWNLNYHMASVPSDQQLIHDENANATP